MEAQDRAARAARSVRRDLGLRPAADLRSAGGRVAADQRAPEDDLHRLPAPRGGQPPRPAAPPRLPSPGAPPRMPEITQRPYRLVTTGGGGDGEALIEWVLRAYESDPLL